MYYIPSNLIPYIALILVIAGALLGMLERYTYNCMHADMAKAAGHRPPSTTAGLSLVGIQRFVMSAIVGLLAFTIGKAEGNQYYVIFALLFVCLYEVCLAAQFLYCGSQVVASLKRINRMPRG